jgi:NADH-quinone oxidoreductase subunit N
VTEFVKPDLDWAGLTPSLVLLGASIVVLIVGVLLPLGWRRPFGAFVAAGAFIAAGIVAGVLFGLDAEATGFARGTLVRDRLAELAQVLVCGAGLLTVGIGYWESRSPRGEDVPEHLTDERERVAEFYALLLAAVAGMAFFVQATTLMTLFLGLEWFSVALYILTAIGVHRIQSLEAGLKYLIVGSFGSAILLFGSALVYGATGELELAGIAEASGDADRLFLVAGLAMLIVGLAFKASAAPFHMWTPDVYEGAPTPVSAFMSAATKVAALIVTMRVLVIAFPEEANLWTVALAVIVCTSLAWGNLAALVQRNVKRMLAYSSVSHAGFLLMPLSVGTELGGRALVFYLIPYAALSIGSFAVVAARERELGEQVTFTNLAGFGWERPFLGFAMATFMLGFIGLPTSGLLLGKFYAFAAAYDYGWAWLAIVGVAATVVSVPYYLGVVKAMFMNPPEVRARAVPAGGSPPRDLPLTAVIAAALVVSIGSLVFADPLIEIASKAVALLPFPN